MIYMSKRKSKEFIALEISIPPFTTTNFLYLKTNSDGKNKKVFMTVQNYIKKNTKYKKYNTQKYDISGYGYIFILYIILYTVYSHSFFVNVTYNVKCYIYYT